MAPDLPLAGPDLSPCSILIGPAKTACEDAGKIVHGAGSVASVVSDPLGSLAKACTDAATWVIDKLSEVVSATTQVNFGNSGFLRVYAIVFGASTFLTLILWVLAVAKRAVRGVPASTAVGEAIGFLWLALAASAFTPLALALVVGLTDQITNAVSATTGGDTTSFLSGVSKALNPVMGGGPVVAVFVSLLALVAAAIIWVELLIRAAMLYVGAVMGAAVYSGLVDRDMWHHVRRWMGVMVAVDLAKPVLVVVLALAAAVTTSGASTGSTPGAFSSVLSGLAVMFLSIFTSVAIYKFVPAFGDDMASLHHQRKSAANAGPAAAVDGPVSHMRRGMAAHGSRGTAAAGARAGTGSGAAGGAATAGAAVGVAAGVAAHTGGAAVRRGVSRMSPPEPAYAGGSPQLRGKHARREGE